MDLAEIILKKRPNLSNGSLRTYKSILTNIYKKCYPDDKEIDLKNFDNVEHIMEHLKDVPFSKYNYTVYNKSGNANYYKSEKFGNDCKMELIHLLIEYLSLSLNWK